MTDLGIFIFAVWFVIGGILLCTNRDLFSPAKMLHLVLLIGFTGIFFGDETASLYLTYFALLLVSLFIGVYEALSLKSIDMRFKHKSILLFTDRQVRTIIVLLWLATSVPVLAQIYMIMSFGGVFNYLLSLTLRVKEFSGWGPVIAIIKFMFVINILYFTILIFSKSLTKKRLVFLFLHTCLMIVVGLLSGSRGTLLGNFLAMMIIYNYWGRPISIKFALSAAIGLIVVATVLGEIRSGGISIAEDEVSLANNRQSQSFGDRARNSTTFNAGLVPIRLIYEKNVDDKQYGSTLIATLTNLIPSVIWEEKPRTGGLVLTQDFTGDSWGGLSNLSTGIVAEGLLNFGLAPGVFLSLVFLILFSLLFNSVYLRTRSRQYGGTDFRLVFNIISYVWFLRTISGLLIGEFANTFIVLILQLISIFIIMGMLKACFWTIELTNRSNFLVRNAG